MIHVMVALLACFRSLPARGAWIEIGVEIRQFDLWLVAPRKGSVD